LNGDDGFFDFNLSFYALLVRLPIFSSERVCTLSPTHKSAYFSWLASIRPQSERFFSTFFIVPLC